MRTPFACKWNHTTHMLSNLLLQFKNTADRGTWLARSVEYETLDFWVVGSSLTLGAETL